MADVTKSFVVEAGILIRWKVFGDIRRAALICGLKLHMEQAGSVARFNVTGDENAVKFFCRSVRDYLD